MIDQRVKVSSKSIKVARHADEDEDDYGELKLQE